MLVSKRKQQLKVEVAVTGCVKAPCKRKQMFNNNGFTIPVKNNFLTLHEKK